MSININSKSLYFRDKTTGELVPTGIVASGADESLAEIKTYAESRIASSKTAIDSQAAEGVQKVKDAIATIPEDYTELVDKVSEIALDISKRLTKPDTCAVGQYFRVASLDSEGNPVLEAVSNPVKEELTDTTATAWTTAEQTAACERIGAVQDKKCELIETITLTEDTYTILRTAEPDGTAYNFQTLYIDFDIPKATGTTYIVGFYNVESKDYTSYAFEINGGLSNVYVRHNIAMLKIENGALSRRWLTAVNSTTQTGEYGFSTIKLVDSITKIFFGSGSASIPMPTGTVIKIYGVRA